MSDEPIIDAAALGSFKIDIKNHVEPVYGSGVIPFDAHEVSFEASLEIEDPGLYEQLLGASPTYTVEIETDHNPWHRKANGARAWARKLRDGVWWTFQRRVLRRRLVERTKITIPNCQIKAPEN